MAALPVDYEFKHPQISQMRQKSAMRDAIAATSVSVRGRLWAVFEGGTDLLQGRRRTSSDDREEPLVTYTAPYMNVCGVKKSQQATHDC